MTTAVVRISALEAGSRSARSSARTNSAVARYIAIMGPRYPDAQATGRPSRTSGPRGSADRARGQTERSGTLAGRVVVVVDVRFLLVVDALVRRVVVVAVDQRGVVVLVAVVVRPMLELAADDPAAGVVVGDVVVIVDVELRGVHVLLLLGLVPDRRLLARTGGLVAHPKAQIGRASCRE